jgi:hypothetical protein
MVPRSLAAWAKLLGASSRVAARLKSGPPEEMHAKRARCIVPLRKGGAAIRGQGTGLKTRRYKGKTQTNGVMGAARGHDVSCPYLGEAACRGVEEASGRTLVRAVGVCG